MQICNVLNTVSFVWSQISFESRWRNSVKSFFTLIRWLIMHGLTDFELSVIVLSFPSPLPFKIRFPTFHGPHHSQMWFYTTYLHLRRNKTQMQKRPSTADVIDGLRARFIYVLAMPFFISMFASSYINCIFDWFCFCFGVSFCIYVGSNVWNRNIDGEIQSKSDVKFMAFILWYSITSLVLCELLISNLGYTTGMGW